MLYHRSVITLQRGSSTTPITYNEPFDAPVINLAPYESLTVDYSVYYHIFLIPRIGKEDDARGRVLYYKASAPEILAIELAQNDWKNEGFQEGDEVLIYCIPSLNITGGTTPASAFYAKINSLAGSTAVFSVYAARNPNLAEQMNYFFVFFVEPERRGRAGVLPATFQTIFKRFGDVDGDVSPISGLRYAEPHADGFLIEEDSHTILGYDPASVPWTGIYDNTNGLDILFFPLLYFLGWTDVPPEKRASTSFRIARRRIRLANFFSYRQEYNTLARSAQRDLYHENADLVTKLVLNSDEREIKVPLRLRLLHANVNEAGAPEFNFVPTISFSGAVVLSQVPSPPPGYSLLGAAFALTTDNNTHHLSTLIRHQHDLTRYRNAAVFILPTGGRVATLATSLLANDLRRNPFETYVVAIWHFLRTTGGSSEEIVVCSDAIPLDIDENINKIIGWQNDASLNYHYHRFNDIVLSWSENEPPEKGEYQVYVRVRKDSNSTAYTAQQYTYKIDESTLARQTSNYQGYYAIHYAHQSFIIPPNGFLTADVDFQVEIASPTQYNVVMNVPPPSFDFPLLRNPNIRPRTGALFHWFEAIGCPIFNITSGSTSNPQPLRVADGEMRIYVLTPTGKVYATNWRQVRAQEPTDLNSNAHAVLITSTPIFVFVSFPIIPNQPNFLKANVRLFQDNINTLKPIAEAAYDATSGAKTTDSQKIFPLFGFLGSRTFIVQRNTLPPGRYKLHCVAQYSDSTGNNAGLQGYADDVDYTFSVGTPIGDATPLSRQECCYTPPLVVAESIPYIVFDNATTSYIQRNITITNNPSGSAWQDFTSAYDCCFKVYDNSAILRENFVDVIAVFDNRLNNIPISGRHWFRYRGFLQMDGYEITEESYVRSDLSEEPVLRTYRRKYLLEIFLTDCDIKQLEFQKLARRWIVRNYTNSLLPDSIEVLVKNIEQVAEYNKLKVTVSLIDYKPDEYRHK